MQTLKLRLKGIAPLLIHNNQAANPLNIYAKSLKVLTSKRNKTDADHRDIARLEWEAGLYLEDGIVVMPAKNIEACFLGGAKKSKNGTKYKSGVMIEDDYYPLSYDGSKIKIDVKANGHRPIEALDKYFEKFNYQEMVKVGTQQVLRTAYFNQIG
jgi:hypothetical protein